LRRQLGVGDDGHDQWPGDDRAALLRFDGNGREFTSDGHGTEYHRHDCDGRHDDHGYDDDHVSGRRGDHNQSRDDCEHPDDRAEYRMPGGGHPGGTWLRV
jgi:hypothetical protein